MNKRHPKTSKPKTLKCYPYWSSEIVWVEFNSRLSQQRWSSKW